MGMKETERRDSGGERDGECGGWGLGSRGALAVIEAKNSHLRPSLRRRAVIG